MVTGQEWCMFLPAVDNGSAMHILYKLLFILLLLLIGAFVVITLVILAYPLLAHVAARFFQ